MLTIVNPCIDSIVNDDDQLALQDLVVPLGMDILEQTIDGPTDSISSLYGNGYDRCGPRSYSLIDTDGENYSLNVFSREITHGNGAPDQITFNLSSSKDGEILTSNFTLVIGLQLYPEAEPFSALVNLEYRICKPYDFRAVQHPD